MRSLTPTWAIQCNGNTPKIRVEWGELELNYRGYIGRILFSFHLGHCTHMGVYMVHVGFYRAMLAQM